MSVAARALLRRYTPLLTTTTTQRLNTIRRHVAMKSTAVEAPSQEKVPAVFRMEPLNSVDLYETTIEDLQRYYEEGKFTSVDYTKYCIERIRKVNPYLECVIETNPDAIEIAQRMDEERKQGKVRGKLHGIPVLVKDNIATKDKMQTTAGSWALLGSIVPRDAFAVKMLREAGAVIIGHANMTEWASSRSRIYSDGYSPRGGQCRSPFDLRRSPFGSSGGSAVSVSANIVPLALGTETDGSIAGPAQMTSVVGLKPTVGLVSRCGVIPTSENLDTIGTFGRTVADAVIGLNTIVAKDEMDKWAIMEGRREEDDYTKFLADKSALKGAKFGLPQKRCWEVVHDDHKELANKLFDAIRELGGEVIPVDYPCVEERICDDAKWRWEHGDENRSEFTVVRVDAYNSVNEYLAELENSNLNTFEDIVQFNKDNTGTEGGLPDTHPAFKSGQDLFEDIAATKGKKTKAYHEALEHIRRETRDNGIDAALNPKNEKGETVQLDALLLCDKRLAMQQISAQAGYPTITIPLGLDVRGMPIGLTIQQSRWQEGKLVKWGSALEDLRNEVLGRRKTPEYRNPTAKNIPVDGNFET